MPQTEILANVTVVTDDDTGMWSIGEVEGQFFNDRLKEHIESHGVDNILIQLNQMIYSAIDCKCSTNAYTNYHESHLIYQAIS